MSKNLIYMISINHPSSRYEFSTFSQYSIPTWEYWCKKNNVDFKLVTESDKRVDMPIWNKEFIFEHIGDKYDKIGLIDADVMIKWDAPNIFEMYDDEFCGVLEVSNFAWVHRSLGVYGEMFFPNLSVEFEEYINAGVTFFTKEHKYVFDELIKFYLDNKQTLDNWDIGGVGKEQTPFNYILKKLNVKKKYLPLAWNLLSKHKNGMLNYNWQLEEDKTPFFIKYANIWHFTGIPIENKERLMSDTWNITKDNYV